jgi:hypothetical protein
MRVLAQIIVVVILFGAAFVAIRTAPLIGLGLMFFGLYTIGRFVAEGERK